MATILTHEATSFSLIVDGMKAAEVLAAAVSAERSIGLTSLRALLKGDVESAKGFALKVEADAPVEAEVPADAPAEVAEAPVTEPRVVTWGLGTSSHFVGGKADRLARKYRRIAESPLLAGCSVEFRAEIDGRVVTDSILLSDAEGLKYTVFPTKRSSDVKIAEVLDRDGDVIFSGSWARLVEFFVEADKPGQAVDLKADAETEA